MKKPEAEKSYWQTEHDDKLRALIHRGKSKSKPSLDDYDRRSTEASNRKSKRGKF